MSYQNPEIILGSKTRFTILGSGTSSGIPTIACNCPTCTSIDTRDKRLRTSLLIETETTTILIDTSPDFRQQMLTNNVQKLDAVLFTHSHFDHIGGFDDLRAFNYKTRKPVDIYVNEDTLAKLKRTFFYAFEPPEQLGGGVPVVKINFIGAEPIQIGDLTIIPIPLLHGKLSVLGFRIGTFAYCTDTNLIPDESMKLLEGVEILVLDALRYHSHPTHFTIDEAVEVSRKLKPKMTYLTHIAHEVKHREAEELLPENVRIAYDGLLITL
jgi:phosphoribosyl 1,2-cyclic phosphate phosphodiesterase